MEPLTLTDAQRFEIERFSRAIDATNDIAALKSIASQLLGAWMTQKAATVWAMKSAMPSRVANYD
jgi:hypothetical protein